MCLEECEQFSSIIDSLLFLACAENARGGMAALARRLEIAPELAAIRDLFSAGAEVAGVTLTGDAGDAQVDADRALLRRAISNLVSNALTHTPRGGVITISAGPSDGGASFIEVVDTGAGIPEVNHKAIFDRFDASSASDTSDGAGLGLGLPITKVIVDLHGGDILLSSVLGKGTRVGVSFPAHRPGGRQSASGDERVPRT